MTVTTPPRFGLRIPASWVEFDLARSARTGHLARILDNRIAEASELRPYRSILLKGLRHLAEEADRAGAVYCAACADYVADDGTLVASVMVFSTEGMPEPGLNTVEAIVAQLPVTVRRDDGSDWREVEQLQHPAGSAVRIRSLSTLNDEEGRPAGRSVSMQTLIPVPGGEGILNVVFTSPQHELVDELLELFDVITATLTWLPGPDPR